MGTKAGEARETVASVARGAEDGSIAGVAGGVEVGTIAVCGGGTEAWALTFALAVAERAV